ncbi:hypothetical protein GCM10009801_12600 [Streptomyces albiaxialis]|uniref:Bacterial bifunctional deaminase-reductase C-terminal domain-containing protein n=1 Tax=Streptomyces albiaxialis TaxID=329523 RepID=A0ABN2VMH6_9ACTN
MAAGQELPRLPAAGCGELPDKPQRRPQSVTTVRGQSLSSPETRAAGIRRVTAVTGPETVVLGSGGPLETLREHDLVDEHRLLVFPLVLGGGKRLFADGGSPRHLTLTSARSTPSGVMINTYRRSTAGERRSPS